MLRGTLCAAIVGLAVSVPAKADQFPFTEGVVYQYQRLPSHLGTFSAHFSGTHIVDGVVTHVRHSSDGSQVFWSETADGDKRLHGFHDHGYTVHWLPPIVTIDEPLYLGKTWGVESHGVDPDTFAIDVQYEVVGQGNVTVPAGTFAAFTIRETVKFPDGPGPRKGGRAASAALPAGHFIRPRTQQVSYNSYADGIGLIKVDAGSVGVVLASWGTVAARPATWTQIRLLYE